MSLIARHSADTQAIASRLLDGVVCQPRFGELDVRCLLLAPTGVGVAVMQVKQDLTRWNSPTGQKMLVVFQFHESDAAQHESALAATREQASTGNALLKSTTGPYPSPPY